MAREAVLRMEGLTVGYGGRAVVRGIDAELAAGEILALIGPNGAGKSTILRTVSRRLPPLGGRVLVEGADFLALPPRQAAKKMAVMLTERPRPELATCFDVAALGRYPHTDRMGRLTARDREAVREALTRTGAWTLRDRDFSRVSDGQRQRVLLARALCQEPRVLLLDEPATHLDLGGQRDLYLLLEELAGEGMAVMLSLHEIGAAGLISDRVLCVSEGTARLTGPREALSEENVCALFGLPRGAYDPARGLVLTAKRETEGGGADEPA